MTFLELQTAVMSRMNLTTTEARTRIKAFLNERYRRLQTSIGLGQVRFGTSSFNTVSGTYTYSPTNLLKPLTMFIPAQNQVLDEKTMDFIRLLDPDLSSTGVPNFYAIQNYGATTCTLFLWPKPDAIYAVSYDGIVKGTAMTADADVPVVPEDFHDILVFGACADELEKMEKPDKSQRMEERADVRTRELRYWMAKSAYLGQMQGEYGGWWWGPWWGNYGGFE